MGSGSSGIIKVQLLLVVSWRDREREAETERGSGSAWFLSSVTKARVCAKEEESVCACV